MNMIDFSYRVPNTLVQETVFGKRIPADLIGTLFSYLISKDFQSTVLVSKAFKEASIYTAKHHEFSFQIKQLKFIDKTIINTSMKELFYKETEMILGSLNLSILRSVNKEMNNELISMLRTLDEDDLSTLVAASKAGEREIYTLCSAILLDKKVEAAYAVHPNTAAIISSLCKNLLKEGNVDKVIEIAITAPCSGIKLQSIIQACTFLLEKGRVDEAIELEKELSTEPEKGLFLFTISRALSKKGNFDKAIELSDKITDKVEKSRALSCICGDLREVNLARALELLETIPDEEMKNNVKMALT